MTGITNPAEPFFKDGIWGWDGTQWRKLPLVFGWSDTYAESEILNDVAAGNHSLTFSTVPAGEIWVVTYWSAYSDQSNAVRIQFQPNIAGAARALKHVAYPAALLTVEGPYPLILQKDDFLTARFITCSSGDDLRSHAAGYKMKVEE